MRIAWAGAETVSLDRGRADRPPGRFNPPGTDALYLNPDAHSAKVALGGTARADDGPRVIQSYSVSDCVLLDLRAPEAASLRELGRQPWRTPLESGERPPSWEVARLVRQAGLDGLIDPSRRAPGLWHVTLLRWNETGAPRVLPIGAPEPVTVPPGHR